MLIFDLGISLTRSPTGLQEKLAESADHHFYLFKVIGNSCGAMFILRNTTVQIPTIRRKGFHVTFAKLNIILFSCVLIIL